MSSLAVRPVSTMSSTCSHTRMHACGGEGDDYGRSVVYETNEGEGKGRNDGMLVSKWEWWERSIVKNTQKRWSVGNDVW